MKHRDAVRQSMGIVRAYGYTKEADEIKASRIDTMKTDTDENKKKMKEETAKVLSKKEQGNWKPAVFEPEEGREVVSTMIEISGGVVTDFLEMFKGLNRLAQEKATERMTELFSNNFVASTEEGMANINARKMYAAVTGEVGNAFKDPVLDDKGVIQRIDNKGTIVKEGGRIAFGPTINQSQGSISALQTFVRGMKPRDFAELDPASVSDIAPYVSSSIAVEIGRYISGDMKEKFAKDFREEVKNELRNKDAWKSYLKSSQEEQEDGNIINTEK
jgi:hypothetical protein